MRHAAAICGLILFACWSCVAQDSPTEAGIDAKVWESINKFANVQKDWNKLNSSGAELRAEELERAKIPDGTIVHYEFFAKNLPHDREYIFSVLRVNQQLQAEDKLKVLDSAGKVNDGPDDPHGLLLMAAKGESYIIGLTSKDGEYKAFTSVVPFPITGSDKGCSIEAVLLMPDAEAVLLRGNGFQPGTVIQVDINSEGEKHSGKVNTDKEGKYSFVLMPYKKDMKKGKARVTASSLQCHPTLQFIWGKGTYHTE